MSSNDSSNRIHKLLESNTSRASYIKAKVGVLISSQIRALRLKSAMPRQSDLAKAAALHQSRISMFENPGETNFTLETLARMAATFRTALVVKFVPFSELLRWENQFSQDHFDVLRIDRDEEFLEPDRVVESANKKPSVMDLMTSANRIAGDSMTSANQLFGIAEESVKKQDHWATILQSGAETNSKCDNIRAYAKGA